MLKILTKQQGKQHSTQRKNHYVSKNRGNTQTWRLVVKPFAHIFSDCIFFVYFFNISSPPSRSLPDKFLRWTHSLEPSSRALHTCCGFGENIIIYQLEYSYVLIYACYWKLLHLTTFRKMRAMLAGAAFPSNALASCSNANQVINYIANEML